MRVSLGVVPGHEFAYVFVVATKACLPLRCCLRICNERRSSALVPSSMSGYSGGASAEIVRKLVAGCCTKGFKTGGPRAIKGVEGT